MVAPMAGLRVLEVANWLAAPSCAALMRDLGADVVKIEPPGGDSYRYSTGNIGNPDAKVPSTYAFELDNRGKRSLTADLASEATSGLMQRLIETSDIFITNLIQRRRLAYHLTPEEVMAINPRIIYVSFSGYGSEGADQDRQAYDHAAFWARAGIMSIIGQPDGSPSMCRSGQGDHTTSLNMLASTLAALRMRDQTGEGQIVDVTLIGTGLWTIGSDAVNAMAGRPPQRLDRTRPASPLYNNYRCADGRWFVFTMAQSDRYWPSFCRVFGHPEWTDDPRYATTVARRENGVDLLPEIERQLASEPLEAWAPRFDAAGLIWAPMAEVLEAVEDPAITAMDGVVQVEDSHLGPYRTMNTPFRIRGADIGVRGPAPAPGEHTMEVLKERGFADEDIAVFAADGVFG